VAWFSIRGIVVLFPRSPLSVIGMSGMAGAPMAGERVGLAHRPRGAR
jgi:hypothetical protein